MLTNNEHLHILYRDLGETDSDIFAFVHSEDLAWLLKLYHKAIELIEAVQIVRKRSASYGIWKRIKEFLNEGN
jgi:hypothetical protein